MSSKLVSAITREEIVSHLQTHFGLSGKLSSLGSCEDLNYKLVTEDKTKYVVKYSNPKTSFEELEFQHRILLHLQNCDLKGNLDFPHPQKLVDRDGTIVAVKTNGGINYNMHVLTFVDGSLLADFKYLDHEVLYTFGVEIASFNKGLSTFPHELLSRKTRWDPKYSYEMCINQAPSIKNETLRTELIGWVEHVNQKLTSHAHELRSQLVHCDLAYYNVVCTIAKNGRPNVSGVIDFGDITETWLVGDLAIAITPLLIHSDRSVIDYTCDVVKGFVSITPLSDIELECLWYVIILRALLLYISIVQLIDEDPENQYLLDEVQLNEQILRKVLEISIPYAVASIKLAAGLKEVTKGISSTAHVMQSLLRDESTISKPAQIIDLSIRSSRLHSGNWFGGEETFQRLVTNNIAQTGNTTTSYIIPMGWPWLTRTKLHSLEAPKTIPTFVSLFLDSGMQLQAPVACKRRVYSPAEVTDRWPTTTDIPIELLGKEFTVLELTWETHHLLICSPALNVLNDSSSLVTIGCGEIIATLSSSTVSSFSGKLPVVLQLVQDATYSFGSKVIPPFFCSATEWSRYAAFVSFDLNTLLPNLGVPASTLTLYGLEGEKETQRILQARYDHVARCQEHYFRDPPQIERGYQQYLYDINGRAYVDMVNNVSVVGHAHPTIAQVAYEQGMCLNTNSRFLYSALSEYAAQIVNTIPATIRAQNKLNRVFFVNSGSEATDLALRIARTVASERRVAQSKSSIFRLDRDVICLTGGYHGVTTASDEVSTTLNDNPRSLETRAPWIHLVPMPNLYRGKVRLPTATGSISDDETTAAKQTIATQYADMIREKVAQLVAQGTPPSAFIAEPLSGNAGGVLLPPGYLAQVYDTIRSVGGLCICDEVQVGYGRLGNVFWCFEEHGIVPDIITMAKAAGNGHPLGFVVTSEDIANEFQASQGSFFSSAGGGPISCRIGSTVLKLIESEGLQANALVVGDYLQEKLLALQAKHPQWIGCIHGHGLYQGIEIVRGDKLDSNGVPQPATEECYAICERLLELGVICHNTGDYSNVLKVKPPLCLSKEDADFIVTALDITLTGW